MKFLLSKISTADLLSELARRCGEHEVAKEPEWASGALAAVCGVMGLEMRELMMRPDGSMQETTHRHVAIALLQHLNPTRPITHISALWGMHHGMVAYAMNKVARLRAADSDFEQKWQSLIRSTTKLPAETRSAARRRGVGARQAAPPLS